MGDKQQQKIRPLTPSANSAYDFAKEISLQQTAETSDDEDPGLSDIPKPGTNVPSKQSKKKKEPRDMPHDHPPSNRRQRSNSQQITQKTVNEVNKNWTGGAPRTIVVRNKIPKFKEHQGYIHCCEGVQFQKQMEWKKAIEKFKLGIALLEV